MKVYVADEVVVKFENGFWVVKFDGNERMYAAVTQGLPNIELKRSGEMVEVLLKDSEGNVHRKFIGKYVAVEGIGFIRKEDFEGFIQELEQEYDEDVVIRY